MTSPTPQYNPEIPQRNNFIADGQTGFLDNFTTLYDAFIKNHVALDDLTNPGNHTNIQLVEQTQSISTGSQEIAIYSKKVTNQTDQLFMRYPSNGKEFQITNYQLYDPAHIPNQQALFFSFLPGGLIVYFGTVFPTTDNFPIFLDPAICINILSVNLCAIAPSTSINNVGTQARVEGLQSQNGKFTSVNISKASYTLPVLNPQYYLIIGNV